MLKNKLNNKGFGKKETMICLLIIVVAVVVGAYLTLDKADSTYFTNFVRMAKEFGEAAGVTRDGEPIAAFESKVFLYDVIDFGYSEQLKSPFNASDICDIYESKIEMEGQSIYITFRCSEYLIYKQISTSEDFTIYKVSNWTEEKMTGSHVQTATFYNYEIDGVEQLDSYYSEKEFLVKYNEKVGANVYFVNYLNSGHNLLKKTYYRTIEEVE